MSHPIIKTPVYTFDLTGGGVPNAARKFCVVVLNYGLIRKYFKADIYDIDSGKGEQRMSIGRRVKQLRKAFRDHNYTPKGFDACALPEHISSTDNGEVTLTLGSVPVPLLNGFQRVSALEILREEGKGGPLERLIDNLPFAMEISLDPDKRKQDFLNLNDNLPIHRSHLLQLSIDTNLVDPRFAPYFKRARDLALALGNNDQSPFYDVIQFDQTSSAPLSANVLMTNRKTDQIMSLFGAAKLLEVFDKTDEWFIDIVLNLYGLILDNTTACNDGKLLEFPTPESGKYKAGASFFLGIVNQFIYYMYLKGITKLDKPRENVFLNCVSMFDADVDGDTSSKRRATLMREFAQKLFEEIVEDPNSPIGGHFGIPYTMVAFFSPGSFGVDAPSIPKAPTTTVKKKGGRKKKMKLADVQQNATIDSVGSVRADSDTSADWTDEI
jgi:hypothetical protein